MYSTLAPVGLSHLIPALGFRKNCKESVSGTVKDKAAADCSTCLHSKGSAVCDGCSLSGSGMEHTISRVMYINEKNKYGEKPVLKKYTLLTYLLLHFMSPDEIGYVSRIDPVEIAELLNCTERTVVNNIQLLNRYGYISASPDEIEGYYQVFIEGYRNIYKPASSGGRGFIRIPFSFLKGLISLPDINNVRLALRSLIFNTEPGNGRSEDIEKSYKKVKSFLPGYVTFKKLRSILKSGSFQNLFHVLERKRSVSIIVEEQYNPKIAMDNLRSECRNEISKYIESVNKVNSGRGKKTLGNLIHLSDRELKDIENISLRLPVKAIIEGMKKFYETYIVTGLKYQSVGALVRTYASDYVTYGYIPT